LRPAAELPHAYPFRFVETVLEPRNADFSRGTVRLAISANGGAAAGEGWQSPLLLAEAIAQSALLLEGGDPEVGRTGFLAGIDGFEASRAPRAGETLEVRVRLAARFGAIVKFDGEVSCGSESLARGSVLVRRGTPAPAPAPASGS
jgi:3-hydroxymyristoyl/3-hydroxydecanoyl-(acyl carrier protein) dehydratase